MAYAVFSKRTKIVNRIVDDLTSLLPSESMIEVDADIVYARGRLIPYEGQRVNTLGFPLFLQGVSPTITPQTILYDGDDRPYVSPNVPIFERPEDQNGNPITSWQDSPITSYPFAWSAYDVANHKYETILSQNYPFQVIIGEEFIDDTHIDTVASDNMTLSEGRCFLAPGGELVTKEFQFLVTSRGVIDPITEVAGQNARQYVFDYYHLDIQPALPQGVRVYWRTRTWADPLVQTVWTVAATNDARALIPYEDPPTTDPVASMGIELRIINQTGTVIDIENYILLLRVKDLPYSPAV